MTKLLDLFRKEAEAVHATVQHIAELQLPVALAELTRKTPVDKVVDASAGELPSRREMARADIGISKIQAGIADTGSVIVDLSRPDHLVSLLPKRHIAILREADIYRSLEVYLASGKAPLRYTQITGPSKTADIEKILVYGAHGPVALDIIVIHPDSE